MDINRIPAEELGKGSSIKLEVCDTEQDIYWRVAIEVLEVINANNQKGEPTVMIVPYGPLGPYARLVYLVNKYRISLKNCVFMNMDEYLTDDLEYIDLASPLSFKGGMNRIFYNLIDDELNVLPENRLFPDPKDPDVLTRIIEKYGKLDLVFGGVGVNGHYAFNEPPEPGEECTNEQFLERKTRALAISRETKTINAYMNCGGDLDGIPQYCVTVGMKEAFCAKKVIMIMPRDWNAGAMRKILHGPITCKVPCSLFRNHPNAKLFTSTVTCNTQVVPEIRIYNK